MLKSSVTGKFILAEYRGEGSRLYIQSQDNIETKRGWWDVFTLSTTKNLQHGLYICKIKKFTLDKKLNDICIVEPKQYISALSDDYSVAILYVFAKYAKDLFAVLPPMYFYIKPRRVNLVEVLERYNISMNEINKLFIDFINNNIDPNELGSCILKRPEHLQDCNEIIRNTTNMKNKYPNLCEKANRMFSDKIIFSCDEREMELYEYCYRLHFSYEKLVSEKAPIHAAFTLFSQAESVIEYYKILDKQKKDAEKANRKAKRKYKKNK